MATDILNEEIVCSRHGGDNLTIEAAIIANWMRCDAVTEWDWLCPACIDEIKALRALDLIHPEWCSLDHCAGYDPLDATVRHRRLWADADTELPSVELYQVIDGRGAVVEAATRVEEFDLLDVSDCLRMARAMLEAAALMARHNIERVVLE